MALQSVTSFEDFQALVGRPLGRTEWLTVDQAWIDDFARVTRDPDPMHVDPGWARHNSPFGTTIAHGFLTLSMLTWMQHSILEWPSNALYGLNYGFDRVRFVAPVRVGSRIRGHFELRDVQRDESGRIRFTTGVSVEVEGLDQPALVADWLAIVALNE